MPREIVHWEIFDESVSRLEAGTLKSYLTQHWRAGYLGALLPDFPYYYRGGGTEFEHVAEAIHGRDGEDTFDKPRILAGTIAKNPTDPNRGALWALLAGYLSHIVVDAVFHPAIYYFTGDYYDPSPSKQRKARAAHRLFEVWLDSWWRAKCATTKTVKISNLLGAESEICTQFLSLALPSKPKDAWTESVRAISRFQSLFLSNIVGALVRGVNLVTIGSVSGNDALFSFGRTGAAKFFEGALRYKNPVSGVERVATLPELREEAVIECLRLLEVLSSVVANPESVARFLEGEVGPSLNFGLPRVHAQNAKHFSVVVPNYTGEI